MADKRKMFLSDFHMPSGGELIMLGRMPLFFLLTACLCRLNGIFLALISLISIMLVLYLNNLKEQEKYQLRKLEASAFYMEQMIYSFKKHHKIPAALTDVSRMTGEPLKSCVDQALDRMEENDTEEALFSYGLSAIEAEYGCQLMRVLHGFLIRVEEQGGECTAALHILLEQLRTWKKSQKTFLSRKKSIQTKLTLAIVLSCLICISVIRMAPSGSTITGLTVYQVCTGGGLMVFQLLYMLFCRMAALADWGHADSSLHQEREKEQKRIATLYEQAASELHGMRYLKAVRKLEKEISLHFPEWLFDLILRLQTENVQIAIANSLDTAPLILVPPLEQMIQEQEEDPVSIQPYLRFLSEVQLPEIHALMLQLYAINEMGKEEIQEQIGAMLEQNQRMTEISDELKMESVLSWMGMLAAIPMMVSVAILVINMSLMLFTFLGQMYPGGTINGS